MLLEIDEQLIDLIIGNQLGLYELTKLQCAYLFGKYYLYKKSISDRVRKDERSSESPRASANETIDDDTIAKSIAKRYRVDEQTVHRNAKFAATLDNVGNSHFQLKNKILGGRTDLSIDGVITDLMCRRCAALMEPIEWCRHCMKLRNHVDNPPKKYSWEREDWSDEEISFYQQHKRQMTEMVSYESELDFLLGTNKAGDPAESDHTLSESPPWEPLPSEDIPY
jgi:hypothetical protein